ncbi:hypothetical protein CDAR_377411 [Caerostris darwini]|uniref:Uncharacterized protein n=1 Tax=Caerostris darwini TaxID=1538125 RepID=A0AAV4VZT2_9ARAC|nr:hypothetical protein CDAR_377411 [Caerostris darwini]
MRILFGDILPWSCFYLFSQDLARFGTQSYYRTCESCDMEVLRDGRGWGKLMGNRRVGNKTVGGGISFLWTCPPLLIAVAGWLAFSINHLPPGALLRRSTHHSIRKSAFKTPLVIHSEPFSSDSHS